MTALQASIERAGSGHNGSSAAGPDSLERLSKDELYERAKAADVPGRSDMTKEELVAALSGS